MHGKVNATGFHERTEDWKENTQIIDTEEGDRSQGKGPDPREVKADIIELIEEDSIQRKRDIIGELEHPEPVIKICIEDLKRENVLQVKNR